MRQLSKMLTIEICVQLTSKWDLNEKFYNMLSSKLCTTGTLDYTYLHNFETTPCSFDVICLRKNKKTAYGENENSLTRLQKVYQIKKQTIPIDTN